MVECERICLIELEVIIILPQTAVERACCLLASGSSRRLRCDGVLNLFPSITLNLGNGKGIKLN